MQVVVLAGGQATRMRPLSERLPKSLFPVAGRPFLALQLDLLRRGGATKVVLCAGYLASKIRDYLAADPPPIPVVLSEDGETPLGTGGAVRAALKAAVLEDDFLVTYGDSYLPIDLRPLMGKHRDLRRPATMAVLRNSGRWDASNCVVEGNRVVQYQKIADPARRPAGMTWIDYGVTAFRSDEVRRWEVDLAFGLEAPLGRLAEQGDLTAHVVTQRFYEVGSPDGLAELEGLLSTEIGT